MPINKKENLVYTLMMVTIMAGVMTTYNIVWHDGFSVQSLQKAWMVFPLTYVIAFAVESLFVGKTAFALIRKFVKEEDALPKKIIISSLCFVTQMVLIMSVIGTLLFGKMDGSWFYTVCITIARNFALAFPLQVLIAGPLVGFVFRKIFPVGTIVVPEKA